MLMWRQEISHRVVLFRGATDVVELSAMDMNSIPVLARGCRLHPTQDILLMPEGTLELNGPSRDVLARVNGDRDVATIVHELLQEYEGAQEAEVRTDVLALLHDLKQRGVVRERT